jgi:benzoyl-CoA-dihydrodiol lyase
LNVTIDASGYHYETVDAQVDRDKRIATITVHAPKVAIESTAAAIEAAGVN